MRRSLGVKGERLRLVVLFFVVMAIAFAVPVWMSYQASFSRHAGGITQESVYRYIEARSRLVTVDELVKALGEDLLLPTWMPDGLELRKIYLWGNTTIQAIVSYSDKEISDYREGKLTIQIQKPTKGVHAPNDPNIVDVGGLRVSTRDRILFFFQGSTYYLITGDYPKEVLIEIATSMGTMKKA